MKVVGKSPCPTCRERGGDTTGDNLIEYEDGHTYCFACGISNNSNKPGGVLPGNPIRNPYRGINPDTYSKFGVLADGTKMYFPYHSKLDGSLCAWHVRLLDPKGFYWEGNSSSVKLFGQHLWPDTGRKIVITEGELDACTVSQLQGNKWPTVSIPTGASSAYSSIKENLDFLLGYDEVILMFDNDNAGKEAAKRSAMLFPAGKVKIASLPLNDPNAMLQANRGPEVISSIWNAQTFYPDEILNIEDIQDDVDIPINPSTVWAYPWPSLTKMLTGARMGEIIMWTSGTGSGKSTLLRQLSLENARKGKKIGLIMLEERPEDTKVDLLSFIVKAPIRVSKNELALGLIEQLPYTQEDLEKAKDELNAMTNLKIYDSKGEKAFERLMTMMYYMAVSLKLDIIVVDHINVIATAESSSKDINDRNAIDNLLQDMRSLVVKTGVHLDVICQLKKGNKAFEEGDDITLQDLKGSGNLCTVPDTIIAMLRNRQDSTTENLTYFKILKNRFSGKCGVATALEFDLENMNFEERQFKIDENGRVVFMPKNTLF